MHLSLSFTTSYHSVTLHQQLDHHGKQNNPTYLIKYLPYLTIPIKHQLSFPLDEPPPPIPDKRLNYTTTVSMPTVPLESYKILPATPLSKPSITFPSRPSFIHPSIHPSSSSLCNPVPNTNPALNPYQKTHQGSIHPFPSLATQTETQKQREQEGRAYLAC